MAVFTDEGKTYHVRVGKGDIGRYVLLPGDPFRTDLIASYFDDAKLVAHNREHKTWTGTLNGVPVSVVSTGMGCGYYLIIFSPCQYCTLHKFYFFAKNLTNFMIFGR